MCEPGVRAFVNTLDEIAEACPDKQWLWNGACFYDDHIPEKASYAACEAVNYQEFKSRMDKAADENAKYQTATEFNSIQMQANRDKENCFRLVEVNF